MIDKIINNIKDKSICIVGFGVEGKSTYNFIRKYLPDKHLTIVDLNNINLDDKNTSVIYGSNYLDNLDKYDLIIKSPGISFKDINTSSFFDRITSQLELLLEVDKYNVIGITGTKGKSTTTTLIYEVLKEELNDVFLLGNIGIPIFDEIDKFTNNSILVIEMSSHQLEFVHNSPHIGILLNLYEDHLDHDGTLSHYHNNKLNIFKYQNEDDFMIYSSDDINTNKYISMNHYLGNGYSVRFDNLEKGNNTIRLDNNKVLINDLVVYEDNNRLLLGDHNLKNIMFILGVSYIFNLDLSKASNIINNFKGLKYRMEYIGTYHGIKYYNDTIATIPNATISAIEALKEVDTLIFGGLNRNINYEDFTNYLIKSSINNFICMPTTGTIIGKSLENNKKVYYTDSLEEAYIISKKVTSKGKICLLSPAAASYEYFKNFEEKGKIFEEIIKKDKEEDN